MLVTRDSRGITGFTMDGHAEAGPYGHDIVCAGASAVSIGAVNAIHALCDVNVVAESATDGGHLECQVPAGLDSVSYEKVQLLLEGMRVSLESIAESYNEFITVEIDRR